MSPPMSGRSVGQMGVELELAWCMYVKLPSSQLSCCSSEYLSSDRLFYCPSFDLSELDLDLSSSRSDR